MLQVQSSSFPPPCFTCSHPALPFQPSHHRCREPCVGAGSPLSHRQRSQAGTVRITRNTQAPIHSCPGIAGIQTEGSCQKKISLCQVWHLYVSWEHVVVTGIHTVDNMTTFSRFARCWDIVWKLCWKDLPVPSWRIWSIRKRTRDARKYVVPPACNHLRKPFYTGAQCDCTQETEPCTNPTSVHWRPFLQWRSFALRYRLPCRGNPSRFLRVGANITQLQAPPLPLKPEAEGLGSQQIWSSFYNPSPACLPLMLKSIDVIGLLIYLTFLPSFVWSQALHGQGRLICAVRIMFRLQHHSSALTAN